MIEDGREQFALKDTVEHVGGIRGSDGAWVNEGDEVAFDTLEDLGITISIIYVSECTSDSLEHHCAQYLARCLEPGNVCHLITTRETPKRRMKETLFTRYRNTVEPRILADNRKATLQPIHTDAVNDQKKEYSVR